MKKLNKVLGIKWECIRHNEKYRKAYDCYCLEFEKLFKKNASAKEIQDFKDHQLELFGRDYGMAYPVNYRISYFELKDVVDRSLGKNCKKEMRDLRKNKQLSEEYLKSQYSINVLPVQKFKALVFSNLMSIMRRSLSIERPPPDYLDDMIRKGVMLGTSIVNTSDRGNLMVVTINLSHTLAEITDDIKKLLTSMRKHFKNRRVRLDADEECLRIYNLKEEKRKSWREIMEMQKNNAGSDHDRLRKLKRNYVKAKRLINDVLTK